MTTKCYEVVLREPGVSSNDGYIIAQIENNKIKALEGILTCDYLASEITEDCITIKYFVALDNYETLEEDFRVDINWEDFELPINFNINLDFGIIEIRTTNTVKDIKMIDNYKQEIKEFKATKVFIT